MVEKHLWPLVRLWVRFDVTEELIRLRLEIGVENLLGN